MTSKTPASRTATSSHSPDDRPDAVADQVPGGGADKPTEQPIGSRGAVKADSVPAPDTADRR